MRLYSAEIESNRNLRVLEWQMKRVEINRRTERWFQCQRTFFKGTLEWSELKIRRDETIILWQIERHKAYLYERDRTSSSN